ncbi:MAG TPA: aminoglycoside phosphotransferase family protein [Phycisphaerae bacterium]|nr:aminoglycoside phosphotransferase family protein [Phycisphaerae bacterium]
MTPCDLSSIVRRFAVAGAYQEAVPYGSGHINDTYAVRCADGDASRRYLLQRINHRVFRQPEKLMENVARVTRHLRSRILAEGGDPDRRSLTLIPTADGADFLHDDRGDYWRMYLFIEGARTYDLVENPDHVYEAARAFGDFQRGLADLPPPRLHETIPDFHHTPRRVEAFREALARDAAGRAADARSEIDFVLRRADRAARLIDLAAQGSLPERITHNDTKFNNVMIDDATQRGLCVVDLDTVMPGLVLYDFGDAVRSGANTAAEDERDLAKVAFNLQAFDRLAHGYLDAARDFLTDAEIDELAFSAWLITLEIGIRFLTDHLAGDVYFKVHRPGHNLDRCRTQFKMVADMERHADAMAAIIHRHRRP